jgi:hypothetical protein
MSEALLPIAKTCATALEAILLDPLEPGAEVEVHMQSCRACSEARVAYLAQEDCPAVLAPAGYFERLSGRVLRKLPPRPGLRHRLHPFVWAAAATLLMAVGAGAFWAGRANRVPLVEATLPRLPELLYPGSTVSDTPFHDREEDAAQVQTLTPEEMKALLNRLAASPSSPR